MTPEFNTRELKVDTAQRTKTEVEKIIKSKGREWLVAAMVEGSIGYYSPNVADIHIDSILRKEPQYNERIAACFGGDVLQEVKFDTGYFARREALNPAYAQACIMRCHNMINEDDFRVNGTFSMMYPTAVSQ